MESVELSCGSQVLIEEDRSLPIVDVAVLWRLGAIDDPEGSEGQARMLARLLRRGEPKGQPSIDERVARLGGRLAITIGRNTVRLHGTVLARHLDPFVELLGELLCSPRFRETDLRREKRRVRSELDAVLDDDGSLAHRQLRRTIFGDHVVATPVGGTHASVGRIRRSAIAEMHAEALTGRRLLFGAAGDVDAQTITPMLENAFGQLKKGRANRPKLPAPKMAKGRRVVIVDKPDRTQTQLGMGTLGARVGDPDLAALVVGDTGFGGLFTARLMQAVREERGWSYSAYSQLGAAVQREAWAMWTHPSVAQLGDCARLQLDLLEDWVSGGLKATEIRFAKRYLVGSRCLDEDTAARRLELALDAVNLGFPMDRPAGYTRRIRAVKRADANAAVAKRIDPKRLAIVAVGEAKTLVPLLEGLPGVVDVQVTKPRSLL
ncbi:MAG: insulinase family protein [Deltaproteobacteria bacterium]|nr:insulinase family protein [Deltaproteobacteria bacterium]